MKNARKKTEYTFDGREVTYEIHNDGYAIYLGETLWITQELPNIPYPELELEECCLKQLENLFNEESTDKEEPTEI